MGASAMEEIFFAVTGCNHYYGTEAFKPRMKPSGSKPGPWARSATWPTARIRSWAKAAVPAAYTI